MMFIIKGQKKIFRLTLLLIFVGNISVVTSQNLPVLASIHSDSIKNANRTNRWRINGIKDGWFVTLSSGVQTIFADDDSKQSKFGKRLTYAPSFTLGKYFSPSWGLKLHVTGGSLHGYNDGADGTYRKWTLGKYMEGKGYAGHPGYPEKVGPAFTTWDPQWERLGFSLENGQIYMDDKGHYRWIGSKEGRVYIQHLRYVSVSANFMFDVFSTFSGYDPERFFEITPFAGITYGHVFAHHGSATNNVFGVNGGLNFRFKLNKRFDLNAEVNGTIYPDYFDGHSYNRDNDGVGQVLAGLTYRFGKKTRGEIDPIDRLNAKEIYDLNYKINYLRNKLNEQPPCPDCPDCPKCPDCPEEVSATEFSPLPIFFRIDKSIIDPREWLKIEYAAQYMKLHTDVKLLIIGYADVQTAYPSYNMKLSERRVNTVAEALINKYGIERERITLDWKGDVEQPFDINELNRVVVLKIEHYKY